MKIRVIYLTLDDWEGIYINGKLHDEGHHLGEGDNFFYLLELSEELGFKRSDILHISASDELCEAVEQDGSLPLEFRTIAHYIDWKTVEPDLLLCDCDKELEKCCDSFECPRLSI